MHYSSLGLTVRRFVFYLIPVLAIVLFNREVKQSIGRSFLESLILPPTYVAEAIVSTIVQPVSVYSQAQINSRRVFQLEAERNNLLIDQVELERLRTENKQLRQIISAEIAVSRKKILGRLTVSPQEVIYNRGSSEGVEVNQTVIDESGVFIGVIKTVSKYSSIIALPSDINQNITVVTQRGILGKLVGTGSQMKLTEVIQTDPLNVGDVVLTTPQSRDLVDGLIIGVVAELTGDPASVTKSALVTPLASMEGMAIALE